jgi:hypothetical protein
LGLGLISSFIGLNAATNVAVASLGAIVTAYGSNINNNIKI